MVTMKFLPDLYDQMKAHLTSDLSVEQGCFTLCHTVEVGDIKTILVKDLITLKSEDFNEQKSDFLSVKPEIMLSVVRLAQQTNTSICMIHTHPHTKGKVAFSKADDYGNESSFEFFNRMLPSKFNSCLVFNGGMNSIQGRVYHTAKSWSEIDQVSVVGEPYFRGNYSFSIPEQFDRQARLLGETGQKILNSLSIVIVGAGGIGSNAAQILAHSGLGKLTHIDGDIVEFTNLPRIIGAKPQDAEKRRLKVDVIRDYVNRTSPKCLVKTFACDVQDLELSEELVTADVIVCTTDNASSREFLNRFCSQHYIVLLDLGVEFVADEKTGELINETGKVNWIVPGSPCLWCSGHVSSELLRQENLSDEDKKQGVKDGYIRNIDIQEPSMMAFNMLVASRGVEVLIGNMTGLFSSPLDIMENFSFIGLNNRPFYKQVMKRKQQDCWLCCEGSNYLGIGNIDVGSHKKASGGN